MVVRCWRLTVKRRNVGSVRKNSERDGEAAAELEVVRNRIGTPSEASIIGKVAKP